MRKWLLLRTQPMKSDANDGKHWSENDVRNLMASLRCGDTIEEAAEASVGQARLMRSDGKLRSLG